MADKPTQNFSATTSIRERIEQAITYTPARDITAIALRISGGLPHQSYSFDFQVDGKGQAKCSLENRLRKRKGKKSAKIETKRYLALLESFVQSGLLDQPPAQGPFLPDTVVGCLEISSGELSYRTYFAADAEQAKTQGMVPSPQLKRVIDKIYAEGGKILGKRSINP